MALLMKGVFLLLLAAPPVIALRLQKDRRRFSLQEDTALQRRGRPIEDSDLSAIRQRPLRHTPQRLQDAVQQHYARIPCNHAARTLLACKDADQIAVEPAIKQQTTEELAADALVDMATDWRRQQQWAAAQQSAAMVQRRRRQINDSSAAQVPNQPCVPISHAFRVHKPPHWRFPLAYAFPHLHQDIQKKNSSRPVVVSASRRGQIPRLQAEDFQFSTFSPLPLLRAHWRAVVPQQSVSVGTNQDLSDHQINGGTPSSLQESFTRTIMCNFTPRSPSNLPMSEWASYQRLVCLFHPHAPTEVHHVGPGNLKSLLIKWYKDHPAFAGLKVDEWCKRLVNYDAQDPTRQVYKFCFEYTPSEEAQRIQSLRP